MESGVYTRKEREEAGLQDGEGPSKLRLVDPGGGGEGIHGGVVVFVHEDCVPGVAATVGWVCW
jgi:hypothetical protein